MLALVEIKKKLGLSKLADQIDLITADEWIGGKSYVREKIQNLLAVHGGDSTYFLGSSAKMVAQDTLDNIYELNRELDKLYRMVYDR